MYVISLKDNMTGTTHNVARTVSGEPRIFQDYAIAERVAHEMNSHKREDDCTWTVKVNDGIYYSLGD